MYVLAFRSCKTTESKLSHNATKTDGDFKMSKQLFSFRFLSPPHDNNELYAYVIYIICELFIDKLITLTTKKKNYIYTRTYCSAFIRTTCKLLCLKITSKKWHNLYFVAREELFK